MKVRITVEGAPITASLIDNATSRDFASLLPLTLAVTDYAATEKISDLPRRLTTDGSPAGVDPAVGDITYYAPWGNLALFHGDAEAVGSAVTAVREGDFVIAPFAFSDGTCPNCLAGMQTACVNGGFFGGNGVDGAQAERVRVPQANGTLVKVLAGTYDDAMMRSLLTLSDVMGTGHHAAVSAGVKPGDTVAVVGDGAVGLSAVLAAKRLGAGRIIALSRNPSRQALARESGASQLVEERGEAAVEAVRGLTGGVGVDAALECVGTDDAVSTALAIARPGSTAGYVGVPHGAELSIPDM